MAFPLQQMRSEFSPTVARGVLVTAVLLATTLSALSFSPWKKGKAVAPGGGPSDIHLYRSVVDRVRSGEGYYDAMSGELQSRGFPTQSLFNWRMPLPIALIAALKEDSLAKLLLGGIAFLAALVCFESMLQDSGKSAALVAGMLLTGPFMLTVLGDIHTMPVVWGGVLITLSLGLLGLKYRTAGVLAGICALFCRELAGPYCAASLLLALFERQWKQAFLWAIGIAAFFAYFFWHASMVQIFKPVDGLSQQGYWLQFGGAAFLISLSQVNAYLLLLPQWVSAIGLTVSLVGLAGWRTPWGRHITLVVSIYLVLFSCIGYDYNQYWGILLTPLLALGGARSPQAIRQLVKDACAVQSARPTAAACAT